MTTPLPEENYDWTFSYKLSRPVYCRQSINDSTIKFDKDSDNNLTGFRIKVTNKTDSEASEISKMKAEKLEKILTILSGTEMKALSADAKESHIDPAYEEFIEASSSNTISKAQVIRSTLQIPR